VIDKIATDCVVNSGGKSNFQLRANSICGRNQDGLFEIRESAIKHPTEASDFGKRSLIERASRELFDLVGCACRRVNIDTSIAVGNWLCHWISE
jgi:hypothetical protein